jgi:hypothetical protein
MGRFAEAEKDLLEAERVVSAPTGVPAGRHQSGLKTLVQLYEAWSKADPRGEHAPSTTLWAARLQASEKSQPQ